MPACSTAQIQQVRRQSHPTTQPTHRHRYFQRDHPELLAFVIRKTNGGGRAALKAAEAVLAGPAAADAAGVKPTVAAAARSAAAAAAAAASVAAAAPAHDNRVRRSGRSRRPTQRHSEYDSGEESPYEGVQRLVYAANAATAAAAAAGSSSGSSSSSSSSTTVAPAAVPLSGGVRGSGAHFPLPPFPPLSAAVGSELPIGSTIKVPAHLMYPPATLSPPTSSTTSHYSNSARTTATSGSTGSMTSDAAAVVAALLLANASKGGMSVWEPKEAGEAAAAAGTTTARAPQPAVAGAKRPRVDADVLSDVPGGTRSHSVASTGSPASRDSQAGGFRGGALQSGTGTVPRGSSAGVSGPPAPASAPATSGLTSGGRGGGGGGGFIGTTGHGGGGGGGGFGGALAPLVPAPLPLNSAGSDQLHAPAAKRAHAYSGSGGGFGVLPSLLDVTSAPPAYSNASLASRTPALTGFGGMGIGIGGGGGGTAAGGSAGGGVLFNDGGDYLVAGGWKDVLVMKDAAAPALAARPLQFVATQPAHAVRPLPLAVALASPLPSPTVATGQLALCSALPDALLAPEAVAAATPATAAARPYCMDAADLCDAGPRSWSPLLLAVGFPAIPDAALPSAVAGSETYNRPFSLLEGAEDVSDSTTSNDLF